MDWDAKFITDIIDEIYCSNDKCLVEKFPKLFLPKTGAEIYHFFPNFKKKNLFQLFLTRLRFLSNFSITIMKLRGCQTFFEKNFRLTIETNFQFDLKIFKLNWNLIKIIL